eukprot:TRINITY_DN25597_c0_g1_i1.p1 TRINITY_DN25597_c0_g1~~TRINITY_DN25597_c0_g1_i1.p1  ORF type:complete len:328 (+),score=102.15 TRINITY_DN25597_c0_g1_i1:64-984(+)
MAAPGTQATMTLWVATDLYGKKYNRGFVFASPPSLSGLINVVESQFDMIARAERPPGYPDVPFEAQSLQYFDALTNAWVDAHSSQQLAAGAQMYCFQPASIWHGDMQEGIPEGTQIVAWQTANGRMSRQPCDTGVPPSMSERIRSTFHELDRGRKGYLGIADVEHALEACEIEVQTFSVPLMFHLMDTDRDGQVSYEEWSAYALTPCNRDLVAALYYRCKDLWNHGRAGGGRPAASSASLALHAPLPSSGAAAAPRSVDTAASAAAQHQRALEEYELLREEAVAARQRADDLARQEQDTYELLYGT